MLSRGNASDAQSGASRRIEPPSMLAIHRSQRRGRLVEQPHAAGVALAVVDQRLDEHAEEAGDVGLADQQIERQLHGVALDRGHALGPPTLVELARRAPLQGRARRRRSRRPSRGRHSACPGPPPAVPSSVSADHAIHVTALPRSIMRQVPALGSSDGPGLVQKSHIAPRSSGRDCRVTPLGRARSRPPARLWPGVRARMLTSHGHAILRLHYPRLVTHAACVVLLASSLLAISTGCAQPAAQPAGRRRRRRSPPPRPSPATSPSGTSSPAGSKPSRRSRSGRASPGYVSTSLPRRRPRPPGQVLFQIDPRPFQAQVDRLRAELARADATDQRAGSELRRAERLSTRERDVARGARAPRLVAAEAAAQVAAIEAALRAAELEPRVHARDRADRRPGRPRHRHRRQPGVERSRRGHAAHDGRVARSDVRVVRRRRADVPALRRLAREESAPARGSRPADPDGAANDDAFPHEGSCTSSTTSSIPRPARSAAARSSATPIGA